MNESFHSPDFPVLFFSREAILAFAPCSTASTRAIESFHRKPNGGNSSSSGYAAGAARKKTMTAIKKIRHIARLIGICEYSLPAHLAIFVCAACILDSPRVPPGTLEARKIALQANPVNSGVAPGGRRRSVRRCDYNRQQPSVAANLLGQSIFFCLPRTRAVPFFSQENFFASEK